MREKRRSLCIIHRPPALEATCYPFIPPGARSPEEKLARDTAPSQEPSHPGLMSAFQTSPTTRPIGLGNSREDLCSTPCNNELLRSRRGNMHPTQRRRRGLRSSRPTCLLLRIAVGKCGALDCVAVDTIGTGVILDGAGTLHGSLPVDEGAIADLEWTVRVA